MGSGSLNTTFRCLVALATLLLAGCATTSKTSTTPAIIAPDSGAYDVSPASTDVWIDADGELGVQVLGSGAEVVMMIATIHGDEAAGTPLLHRLAAHVGSNLDLLNGVSLVLVPVANPDGHERDRRTNARGVDLNRNFPSSNFSSRSRNGDEPLSQWESRALHDLVLRWKPARVVSIHQPLRCIDYDGPAQALAEAMADACDLPVRKLGARPGSLGSWVGLELGIPIITVELPGAASRWNDDRRWDRYGNMLLAAIQF